MAAQVGYSARVADQPVQPQFPDAPILPNPANRPEPADEDFEPEPKRARDPRPRSAADAALPWVLAAMVVLILAASAGLVLAWLVATMHEVPGPIGAGATPTTTAAASVGPSGAASPTPTIQPRRTPEPSASATAEPAPFIHVVQRGESLTYIAALYGVSVDDIIALNDIQNPDKIREGRQLLIPGYGHEPSPSPGHG